tara:strand:- start:485 stop:628 length:144 start_codon:yes stop_codon:yes gene_type:complete
MSKKVQETTGYCPNCIAYTKQKNKKCLKCNYQIKRDYSFKNKNYENN